MSTQNICFLWRNKNYYPRIITKYSSLTSPLHLIPTLAISSSSFILISILMGVVGNALKMSLRVGICLSSSLPVTQQSKIGKIF